MGKAAVIGGGGVAVYFLYRKWQSQSSSSSSSTANTTDPTTGMPYADDNVTDPLTGMTYLMEAEQYGSVSAAESAVSGGYGASAGPSGLAYGSSYSDGTDYGNTSIASTVEYPDNASWAQAVQAGLSAVGYTSTDVSGALGAYLSRLSLSSAQASIVQAAIAEYGPPPVGTYSIIQNTTPPPPPNGTTTGTGTTGTTSKPAMPSGVRATPYSNFIDVGWNAVTGATGYTLKATYQEPASGGSGVYTGTVHGTSGRISGLSPNRTYTIHVAATNSAGSSAETNGPAVKTK